MKIFFLSLYDELCMGMRMLSAVLRQEGHEVRLAFLHSYPQVHSHDGEDQGASDPEGYYISPAKVSGADLKALAGLVREFAPDLIGVGHSSNFFGLAARVTKVLRTVSGAPIIWGGVDATGNPDLAIEHADMVCLGEGEGAMLDLTRRMGAGQPYTDIPNLWVRQEGTIHRNPLRPLIDPLDSLPWPDFDVENKYWITGGQARPGAIPTGSILNHSFSVMAGRGCLYGCTYCCNSMYRELYGAKGYVRLRSAENVIEEIVQYLKLHPEVEIIEFWDDVFGFDPEWMEKFVELYPRRVGKPFWCYTYPAVCRPELVQALKQAGVSYIVMGLQSGSQRTLREDYHRNASRQKTLEAARMIGESGIPLVLDLILGNPFESEEDYLETLELMLDLPAGFILQEINSLALYRNYPLSRRAEEAGHTLTWFPGRNVAQVLRAGEFLFWRGLLTLTQFPQIKPDTLRTMARDPHLRSHPEAMENLARAFEEAIYLPGTRTGRLAKLEGEVECLRAELCRYRDSRAVQGYFRLKEKLKGAGR